MRQWNYLQASLHSDQCDSASGILWELGTQGIEETPLQTSRLRLRAYFDPILDIERVEQEFKEQCKLAGISIAACSSRVQTERDWFRKWRQHLQPFSVGRRFRIVPFDSNATESQNGGGRPANCQDAAGDRTAAARYPLAAHIQERIPILIEPGMAFGTGTHETTQLCLEALERYVVPGTAFADIGTGSGILAIAAIKLGARSAWACDIDPLALKIAKENGAVNHCGSRILWVAGEVDRIPPRKSACLTANLTAEIIEGELPKILRVLKPRSPMILSGILNRQASRINRLAESSGLRRLAQRRKGDWTCVVYELRG